MGLRLGFTDGKTIQNFTKWELNWNLGKIGYEMLWDEVFMLGGAAWEFSQTWTGNYPFIDTDILILGHLFGCRFLNNHIFNDCSKIDITMVEVTVF